MKATGSRDAIFYSNFSQKVFFKEKSNESWWIVFSMNCDKERKTLLTDAVQQLSYFALINYISQLKIQRVKTKIFESGQENVWM